MMATLFDSCPTADFPYWPDIGLQTKIANDSNTRYPLLVISIAIGL